MVSSGPSATLSSRNCTPATPTLSEAEALTVVVPDTVAPLAGEVILTVGGVVSGVPPPPLPLVTSKASTTIQEQQAEALQVPVTLIITVCVPAARPLAVYITACACWVGEYVSTVALRTPSR